MLVDKAGLSSHVINIRVDGRRRRVVENGDNLLEVYGER